MFFSFLQIRVEGLSVENVLVDLHLDLPVELICSQCYVTIPGLQNSSSRR